MKSNQNGFSIIDISIIFVAVCIIGAVGWFVYQRQGAKGNEQSPPQSNEQKLDKDKETSISQVPKQESNDKPYFDNNFSIMFPGSWTQYKKVEEPDWVFFKSSDFIPAQELGPSVEAGQLLEVRVSDSEKSDTFENVLQNAPIAQQNHGGTYETIKIDGKNAILSNTKTHGTFWTAITFSNGKTYYFRFNVLDETKPGVKEQFKSILETVKLK